VLDGSLGPGVGRVQARECGQQRGDDRDELPSVDDVLGAGLEDEEGGLGVYAAR